jgi:hypothetical protein
LGSQDLLDCALQEAQREWAKAGRWFEIDAELMERLTREAKRRVGDRHKA